jgi:hypothetical protein
MHSKPDSLLTSNRREVACYLRSAHGHWPTRIVGKQSEADVLGRFQGASGRIRLPKVIERL